jgi:hypothetical protein
MVVHLFLALTASIRWRLLFPALCWPFNTSSMDFPTQAAGEHAPIDGVPSAQRGGLLAHAGRDGVQRTPAACRRFWHDARSVLLHY